VRNIEKQLITIKGVRRGRTRGRNDELRTRLPLQEKVIRSAFTGRLGVFLQG
jgi:hypothetical protein